MSTFYVVGNIFYFDYINTRNTALPFKVFIDFLRLKLNVQKL